MENKGLIAAIILAGLIAGQQGVALTIDNGKVPSPDLVNLAIEFANALENRLRLE
jgi:hypothetical protein